MVAHTMSRQAQAEHIRPFVPHRDLADLANLIERAFGDELAASGSHIVHDLRQMALLSPLLRATVQAMAPFRGLVWVEDGLLVGNVSLSPELGRGSTWTVSNVAVLPAYQGRGIAGHLMDCALEYLRTQGVRRVSLQVRADNARAITLYQHRRFVRLAGLHEMQLDRYAWPVPVPADCPGLHPVRFRDRRALRALLTALTAPPLLQVVMRQALRRPLVWHIGQRVREACGLERSIEVVAERDHGLVAYGVAHTSYTRGPHELALHVQPDARGPWEAGLLTWLLRRLRTTPAQPVRALLASDHTQAAEAAGILGFHTVRILDQMALDL